jgi:pimeloyl-ACP methyl ester carboxylesterase
MGASQLTINRMPKSKTFRLSMRIGIVVIFSCITACVVIYRHQHAFVYHPRPYDESYAYALPDNGEELPYSLPIGKQTAFYVPATNGTVLPRRIWFAFCGNGSLALDWTSILFGYPNSGDAFVLIDYPGYGKCAGYATIATPRASADAALNALAKRLAVSADDLEPRLCTIGHSLGSAVALDFATRHRVQRVVAIAPFTTLREEAARVVSNPLSHLLIESYDNRAAIEKIRKRNPDARIAIFHGTADEVIPVRMGEELARRFPFVEFFPVAGADHVGVLNAGHDRIVQWMKR